MQFRRGVTREVILIGRVAVKLPSVRGWRFFLMGLLANLQEREFAATGWPELCPIFWSAPGGLLSIMPRCRPLTPDDWIVFDHREFCSRSEHYAAANYDSAGGHVNHMLAEPEGMVVPAENKQCSFGWLGDRIVAVDYGN